jgi:photosystem II stability/assembly factor-like uncharacterized protein
MKGNRAVLWKSPWAVCVLVMVFCFSAHAGEWKLVAEWPGPGGGRPGGRPGGGPRGWINQLVIHPTKPNVFYAATEGAGVLVSEDGGSTWTRRNEGLQGAEEGTVSGYHIRCLAIDPTEAETTYAGMAAFGVFKTTDDGASWTAMNELLGDTFTKVMAIHPAKPDTLYLGTDGGGMYRRTSGSSEWEEIIEGMRNTYVKALVMDPKNPDVMYVGTDGGISKTTNGGDAWVNLSGPRYVLSMAIDPENTEVLYAGTDGSGVLKTEDGGDNWVSVGGDIWMTKGIEDEFAAPGEEVPSVLLVSSLAVNPVNTAIVYAGNPSGVFRSADGGQTWAQINAGLTNTEIKSLTITSAEPVTVYAGTADGSLLAYTEE